MDYSNIRIAKENGNVEDFDPTRIKNAIDKAQIRTESKLSNQQIDDVINSVIEHIRFYNTKDVVLYSETIHNLVVQELFKVEPNIAIEYKQFRSYKHELNDKISVIEKKLHKYDNENIPTELNFDQVNKDLNLLIKKHPNESYYSLLNRYMSDELKANNPNNVKNLLLNNQNMNKIANVLFEKLEG